MIIDFKAHVMPGMDKTCKNRIDTIRRLMAAKDAGGGLIVAVACVGKDDIHAQPSREPAQHGLGGVVPCCVPHVQDKAPVAEAELIQLVGCQKLIAEFDHRGRHDLGKLIVHEAAEDILALAAAVKKFLDATTKNRSAPIFR